MITTSPSVLLVPVASPLRSVNDLLEAARARPGQLNYGSGGVGSSQHLAGASFKQLTGVDFTHIPYKGDRKSTRLNSSHLVISYAVFCLKKKTQTNHTNQRPPI